MRPLRPLDPTWWCKGPGGYNQQDNRARLVRLKEQTKVTGWALYINDEYRGSWPSLNQAKRRAAEITTKAAEAAEESHVKNPQPMQPIVKDPHGVLRFRANAIIRYIVDHAGDVVHPGAPVIDPDTGRPYHQGTLDLDKLMMRNFSQEDREQFAQLMGYSITGYHELSFVSDESAARASTLARAVDPEAPASCREAGCPVHGGPVDVGGRASTKES